jgi:AcrR family transcriptional regulator
MARLTRAQQRQRTRATVLAAAAEEFAQHGFTDAKVDRIADRAELTRGAVYSNFPSKRSLYLAVLLDSLPRWADGGPGLLGGGAAAERVDRPGPSASAAGPIDVAAGAEGFARVWLERLPLSGEAPAAGKLTSRSVTGVFDDEPGRTALAEVMRLEGLLLALALEAGPVRPANRRVRLAELILTVLNGASHLAQTAPGFGDPFDVVQACRQLASLDTGDRWDPPHLPHVAAARSGRGAWTPSGGLIDELTGRETEVGDGVLVVLGTARLSAAEEAVRAARAGDGVTVAVVTTDPAETGALIRLRILDLVGCLRRAFGPAFAPPLRLVLDEPGTVAAAIGVDVAEDTEAAVRLRAGHIVARANGRGAAHAAAIAPAPARPKAGNR